MKKAPFYVKEIDRTAEYAEQILILMKYNISLLNFSYISDAYHYLHASIHTSLSFAIFREIPTNMIPKDAL